MQLGELFKSHIFENVTSVSIIDTAIYLALAFLVGMFIFCIYKRTYRGVWYSLNFATSLVALTMITTIAIIAVMSNVALSLGAVGVLCIVRFQVTLKKPLDTAYLFWAIAAGIVIAAGMLMLALLGSLMIGALLLAFINKKPADKTYILTLSCADAQAKDRAVQYLKDKTESYVFKSIDACKDRLVLELEIFVAGGITDFVVGLSSLDGVEGTQVVVRSGDHKA